MEEYLAFYLTGNIFIPIGYVHSEIAPENNLETYVLNRFVGINDYDEGFIQKVYERNENGVKFLVESSENVVYPKFTKSVTTTLNNTTFIFNGTMYTLQDIIPFIYDSVYKNIVSPIQDTPSEDVSTKGVGNDTKKNETSCSSDSNLIDDSFQVIFGKLDNINNKVEELISSSTPKAQSNDYTEQEIVCNNEPYLDFNSLKQIYTDKLSTALEGGYLINNTMLSYTIKKLQTVFNDEYIINNIVINIEKSNNIKKLLLNSISTVEEIDRIIKGMKVLLKNHPFSLNIIEVTLENGLIEFYSNNVKLDRDVIIHMLQNNLHNYNVALDKLNSNYQKVNDLTDKLLCPEYLIVPNNSNNIVGLVVSNCYVTKDSDMYYIPIKGSHTSILKDLHFTEPLDLDELIKYVKVVVINDLPASLKTVGDIESVVNIINENDEFANLTLLPELNEYITIINKELS